MITIIIGTTHSVPTTIFDNFEIWSFITTHKFVIKSSLKIIINSTTSVVNNKNLWLYECFGFWMHKNKNSTKNTQNFCSSFYFVGKKNFLRTTSRQCFAVLCNENFKILFMSVENYTLFILTHKIIQHI